MKYVSEGIKSLFVLNGAATISILTFIGNTKSNSHSLVYAMICFAIGSVTGPIAFWLAYITQLQYGNAVRMNKNFDLASKYHFGAYAAVAIGIVLFLSGIFFAGCGLLA